MFLPYFPQKTLSTPKLGKIVPAGSHRDWTDDKNGRMRLFLRALFVLLAFPGFADNALLPAIEPADCIIRHQNYTLSYSEEHEQAEWVAYELTRNEILGQFPRQDAFRSDPLVETGSAALDDYRKSGFDRGHLAPAADMKFDAVAMRESFLLSNMSPQDPRFNRGIWKRLEAVVRQFAYDAGAVHVVTGPVLTESGYRRIGINQVSVPEYFYKVVLDFTEPELKAIGFVLPNTGSEAPLEVFARSVDEVEDLTGLDFFAELPDHLESALESRTDIDLWDFREFRADSVPGLQPR